MSCHLQKIGLQLTKASHSAASLDSVAIRSVIAYLLASCSYPASLIGMCYTQAATGAKGKAGKGKKDKKKKGGGKKGKWKSGGASPLQLRACLLIKTLSVSATRFCTTATRACLQACYGGCLQVGSTALHSPVDNSRVYHNGHIPFIP
jgi:hypothetical protein